MTNPTLKKIADTLGCSISTVSRALKYHPDISVKTREKVLELANTLEYEPNAFAVHLRTKNSMVIGLMVPVIANYFYESFITAIEEESRKNGYTLMILQSANDPLIELANIKLFRQNRVSGLFVCALPDSDNINQLIKLKELNIPVVFFDNVPNQNGINKSCIADELAASIAAETILKSKKKHITALFGDARLTITQKRLKALETTIHKNNSSMLINILHAINSDDAENKIAGQLSNLKKSSIIFCMSDELLIGAMRAIQNKQLKIPNDISVISISNGFIPKLYYPSITYIETSGYKLGKLAFTQMLACISGAIVVEELTLDAALVEGGSI